MFHLEYSFKGKDDLGNPLRLMDYADGKQFTHSDWKQINDPKLKIYAFQRQGEGAFAGGIWLTPDWKLLHLMLLTQPLLIKEFRRKFPH